jgi:sugar lactone lactonase YvrE
MLHRGVSALLSALLVAGCIRYVNPPSGGDDAAPTLDQAFDDANTDAQNVADGAQTAPDEGMTDLPAYSRVTTYAGSVAGHKDGTLTDARFKRPHHLVVDTNGDIYVTGRGNHVIRRISGNTVSTVAGSPGAGGYQDGPAATAKFNEPDALFLDGDTLYISEAVGVRVRVLDLAAKTVTTLAGSGTKGFKDGAAADAQFNIPKGLVVAGGKVYVADYYSHRIRVIHGGKVETFAGDGKAGGTDGPLKTAQFHNPHSLALSNDGRILVADKIGNRIRRIDPAAGTVTTLAGGAKGSKNGSCSAAQFNGPSGLVEFPTGYVIVADHYNRMIRVVNLAGGCSVDTLAGSGTAGSTDGTLLKTQFGGPEGVAVDLQGRLLVADTDGHRIRRIEWSP